MTNEQRGITVSAATTLATATTTAPAIKQTIKDAVAAHQSQRTHKVTEVIDEHGRVDLEAGMELLSVLSQRELEVFDHMSHGLTTKQIAKRLHVSPKTIETHREHIKFKLQIRDATQLIRYAVAIRTALASSPAAN